MKLISKDSKTASIIILLVLSFFLATTSSATAGRPTEPDDGASPRPASIEVAPGGLVYRGGPVVNKPHTIYSIFWIPQNQTVSANYQSLINRYLMDVAADSGKTTNIYASVSQYTDDNGPVPYQATFGGTYLDTAPFPGSDCVIAGATVCLSDDKIQERLNLLLPQLGWTPNMEKIFFIFLPKGVGSCYSPNGTFCSPQNYCAYHHSYDFTVTSKILYAVQPYAMNNQNKCGSLSHPNGNDADSTINLVAHEHNEILSDPLHSAWYDANGRERADRCVWQFGQTLGWTLWGRYNQVINNNKYYLQLMWNNKTNSCVQSGT